MRKENFIQFLEQTKSSAKQLSYGQYLSGKSGLIYAWEYAYGGITCKRIVPKFHNSLITYYDLSGYHMILSAKTSEPLLCISSKEEELTFLFEKNSQDFIVLSSDAPAFFKYGPKGYGVSTFQNNAEIERLLKVQKDYKPLPTSRYLYSSVYNDDVLDKKIEKLL